MTNKLVIVLGGIVVVLCLVLGVYIVKNYNLQAGSLSSTVAEKALSEQKSIARAQTVYIIGGDGPGVFQDGETWKSSDVINWQYLPYTNNPVSNITIQLPSITQHAAVFFNGKFWVTGGIDYTLPQSPGIPTSAFNTIYNSVDGKNWVRIDTDPLMAGIQDAPWSGRFAHKLVVFQNKMYLIGGAVNSPAPTYSVVGKDVWSTSDGVNWTRVDSNPAVPGIQDAPWSERMEFSALVFDNKLWIFGGSKLDTAFNFVDLNDVWYTTNGVSWISATPAANWTPRAISASTVYNGKMWVFGGQCHFPCVQPGGFLNDAWYSINGVNWTQSSTQVVPSLNFISILNAFVLNNTLHVISGESPVPLPPGPATDIKIYTSKNGTSFNLLTHNPPWRYINHLSNFGWGRFNFSLIVTP